MNEQELREFIWERCEADDTKTDEIMKAFSKQVQIMVLEARIDTHKEYVSVCLESLKKTI